MKRLFLIRHAKSSWADASLSDIQRPLNKRGLRDAPFMAKLMVGKQVIPDLIITSPAVRAHTTAQYFHVASGLNESQLHIEKTIYHAYPEEIFSVVQNVSSDIQTLFVFGHNPGFTSFANYFAKEYIANVPTCGIVEIETAAKDWKNFSKSNGVLKSFYFPKQYFS